MFQIFLSTVPMKLTNDEAKKVVELYYSNGKSPTRAFRQFNTWAEHNNCVTRITKKNVIDAIRRFESRTMIQKVTKVRPSMMQDEAVLLGVLNSLYQQRGSSLRTCAADNDLSLTMTQKIARRALQLYPYRLILLHAAENGALHCLERIAVAAPVQRCNYSIVIYFTLFT